MVMATTEAHASGNLVRGNVRPDIHCTSVDNRTRQQRHRRHRLTQSVDFDNVFSPNNDTSPPETSAILPHDTKLPASLAEALPFSSSANKQTTSKLPLGGKASRQKSFDTPSSARSANVRTAGRYSREYTPEDHRPPGITRTGNVPSGRAHNAPKPRHIRRSSDFSRVPNT